jgi:hypothetical protein
MKQSSIEWLFEQYKLIGMLTTAQVEKAKRMHKEELLDTWEDSRIEYMGDDYIGNIKSFDDYYNETFNTK